MFCGMRECELWYEIERELWYEIERDLWYESVICGMR